ncbi:MAG: EamA family transporter [Candidatus Omnitrophica bacterium]|nr:EamA family transporter [Candidatus Omnitrophota bacterium]
MKMGFIYAMIAMLLWGAAPIFAKIGLVKTDPLIGVAIRSIAISLILVASLAIGGGFNKLVSTDLKSLSVLIAEGVCAGLLGQYFYFKAVKVWEASKVVPIVGAYPLAAVFFAILFLGEHLTLAKGFGTLLIIAGIFFLR